MKKNGFAELGIDSDLAEALAKEGYTDPTPIQKQAIPLALTGDDLIAQAQTGTGKTLAFLLPMLESLDANKSHVQGLVITPTRELAIQITDEVKKWAPLRGLRVLSAYGGQDVERQIRKLEGAVHMIIATPGRLLDHLRRETVDLGRLSVLVLDEADQMLHMGFLTEVQEIIMQTPTRRQTMLFSATMPDKIKQLARNYMRTPKEVAVQAKKITLEEIDQVVVRTTDRGKLDALCKTIDEDPPYLGMIFCRTKLRATKLNAELNERGYSSDELHGDLTQAKREQVMKRFRDAKIQLLVATDIAARGLDVEGITHVYNYDIPHDAESYIHRIGRTGRAGERGKAITFAAPRDADHLEKIERGIKQTLAKRQGRAPEGEQASRGRGGEQARAGRGGEQARAGRGGEQARAGRGGEQARAGRGGEQARAGRGGEQARVGRGGEQARVGRGGEQARAGRGGEQARAGRGGEQATRGRGGEQARAGRGGEQATRGRGGEQARGAGTAARGRGTDKAATWATGNPARAGVAARGRGADTKRGGANRSGGGRRGR